MPRSAPRHHRHIRAAAVAAAALGLSGTAVLTASPAIAAPGDNGDVKIHKSTTAVSDQRNEPKVCSFYLDAFNFDTAQQINYSIVTQPKKPGGAGLTGKLILKNGAGFTANLSLPNGMYKLTWKFTGENGAGKMKVFKVECTTGGTGSPGTPGEPGTTGRLPRGGVAAGSGGTQQDPSPTVVGAGLAATGTAAAGALFLTRRARRNDGA
ncbi:hypothetical protein QMK19_20860 [Streptomyces sp. H10-C2]|uniref:hypothetical protein n=1 Tax=unclassified Streptomyces TaxID=2593676 RepID=UPI0024BA7303|nr:MULTISPECIES: hypothetical protein [unclassified Streptomyces]MDJ0344462.1 hypothetical protein [Streptomyces sp. PH10-H1]MDJ0372062.1 hypothetical protein [Streptomyces sp. H10-C2]